MKQAGLPDAMKLFMEGSIALAKAEAAGIRIDVEYLDRAIRKIAARIQKLQDSLYADETWRLWQKEFKQKANIGSRPQLAKIVFDKLGHKSIGQTKKSKRTRADAAAFENVDLPFVKDLLKLEKLKKVKSTYLDGLKRETVDGRLHPFFHLAGGGEGDKGGARSYRGSSSAINFQNLVGRDEEAAAIIRRAFIPDPGCVLIDVDYGAMEWKIACAFWADPAMMAYANDPKKDVHKDWAAKCYRMPRREVSKEIRYCGKNNFVFPELYGSYYKQMAKNLWSDIGKRKLETIGGASVQDILKEQGIEELGACSAKEDAEPGTFECHIMGVEEEFNRSFPVFAKKKDEWYDEYRKNGGFPMLTGFWVDGLYTKNAVYNYPIQGPAFHCLLWSQIELQKWTEQDGRKTRILGNIHDCCVASCRIKEIDDYLNAAKRIMTEDIRKTWPWITVPLSVEVLVTPEDGSWFDKRLFVEHDGKWGPAK